MVWNSLTYYSEKLADIVDTSVTLVESMMAGLSPLNSVEQYVTAANENSIYIEWIKSINCLLHCQ